MQKGEAAVKGNTTNARVEIGKRADLTIGRMADAEGRSKQRQYGIVLERVAQLFEKDPSKLAEIGIISPLAASVDPHRRNQ